MIYPFLAIILSLAIAWVLVPRMSGFAQRVGLIDQPDDSRKLHKNPIPMVGGIAIFLTTAFVGAVLIAASAYADSEAYYSSDLLEFGGLLVGSGLLLLVGIADDIVGIRGRQKLLGQMLAIAVLVACGFHFDHFTFLKMKIQFGVFSTIVVFLWMLAAINSVNLLDGADGFATTVGIIMSLSLSAMSIYQDKYIDAVITMSLAGALIAFLKYNFPPAKAFLGDSGSMLIGFVLGAMAIRCTFKQPAFYAFTAPIALLAIPFIDTAAAIIRRRLTGRSIYQVDRGHLHHQLAKQGFGPKVSLLWVALLCTTTAFGAVMSLVFRHSIYAVVSILVVGFVLLVGRIFGVAEFQLISNRAISIAKSFLSVTIKTKVADVQQSAVHVQGNRDWQIIWGQMCNFADEFELNQLTMDLNVPWIHESFHATRRLSGTKRDTVQEWYTEIPLIVEGKIFGRVEVLGSRTGKFSHHEVIKNLLTITEGLEVKLASMEEIHEFDDLSDTEQASGEGADDAPTTKVG